MASFFDTNVLVYLFDKDAPGKQVQARRLLDEEVREGRALISTQVLQEFYVSVTRKLAVPLDTETAYRAVQSLTTLPTVQIDGRLVLAAVQRSRRHQLAFWDALIIEAALVGGAER